VVIAMRMSGNDVKMVKDLRRNIESVTKYNPPDVVLTLLDCVRKVKSEENDYHKMYVREYFENVIEKIMLEERGVVKLPVRECVERKLEDVRTCSNVEEIFRKLESDKELNENLFMATLDPDFKEILREVERDV